MIRGLKLRPVGGLPAPSLTTRRSSRPRRFQSNIAADEPARLGRVQDRLYTPTKARGGFRRSLPKGLQDGKRLIKQRLIEGKLY
jgi:hypothetical protein